MALSLGAWAQVRGRVVMAGAERSDILVSLVSNNGQIVHQAFTGARGTFQIEGVTLANLRSDNPMYIVIEEEGYKPYRQRILQADLRGGGITLAIFLEPKNSDQRLAPDETVDVRQSQADVPRAAIQAWQRGLEILKNGSLTEAVRLFENAVALAPGFYDAWVDLGALRNRLGEYDAAKAAYMKAAEANPAGAEASLNLGILYYEQGNRERQAGDSVTLGSFSLAREWLEKAVRLEPSSGAQRFYMGATLYRLAEYLDSEDWLRRAIAMDDGYAAKARSMLINVYTRQSRYEAALEETVAFLKLHPDSPERPAVERVKAQIEALPGGRTNQ